MRTGYRAKVCSKTIPYPPSFFSPSPLSYSYATGVDVYKVYTDLLVPPYSQSAFPPHPKHTIAHIIRRTSQQKYKYSRDEIREKLGDSLLAFHEMPEVFREALGEEGWIVRVDWEGEGAEKEREAVRAVARMIQEHV